MKRGFLNGKTRKAIGYVVGVHGKLATVVFQHFGEEHLLKAQVQLIPPCSGRDGLENDLKLLPG